MIVNHADKWLYVAIPKNGTTSLTQYLQQSPFNGTDVDPGERHLTPLPEGCESYRSLVVVRNPYSRFLSLWRHAVLSGDMPEISISEFVDAIAIHPKPFYRFRQVDYCQWAANRTIVHLERIYAGVGLFFGVDEPPRMPLLNLTESTQFSDMVTEGIREKIRSRFRDDFSALGYAV